MLDSPFLFVLLFANISEYAILGGLKKLIRQPPVNSWEYIRPGDPARMGWAGHPTRWKMDFPLRRFLPSRNPWSVPGFRPVG